MKEKSFKRLADVEQILEKEIQILVNDAIGQSPSNVHCIFIGKSDLAVLIESVDTPLENFLVNYCQSEIVRTYREGLKNALKKRVSRLVEEVTERPIQQADMSRQAGTRWMGMFALL